MRRSARRFVNHVRTERGMSPATISSYRDDLKKFIEFLEIHWGKGMLPGDVTSDMIQQFLEFLGSTGYRKRNCPSSRAKRLVAIRSFFSYLKRENFLGKDPAEGVKGPKITYAEPHFLQEKEYRALLRAATYHQNAFIALRDQALLATFLGTGARVSELINVDLKDLDIRAKRIRLHRKGGDVQTIPLSKDVLVFLCTYLKQRRQRAHCRAAFVSMRGQRLTQQSVGDIVNRCASRARLPKARISPHTLRHTFATTLLSNGENLQTIRVLMNHKSLSTTARYLHTQDEQLSAAVNGISLYVG
jgi:site-specific recombinase XerD